MLRVTAVESVHRSPVAAVDVNPLSVHNEGETSWSVLGIRGRHVQLHCAYTYLFPFHIHLFSIPVQDSHGSIVQRRLAITSWPPEFHIVQSDYLPSRMRRDLTGISHLVHTILADRELSRHRSVLILHRQCDGIIQINSGGFPLHIHVASVPMRVHDMNWRPHLQSDIPPKARAHKPGHDVPTVSMRGSSGIYRLYLREIVADNRRNILSSFDD